MTVAATVEALERDRDGLEARVQELLAELRSVTGLLHEPPALATRPATLRQGGMRTVDFSAPLPLSHAAAVEQARRLHVRRLPWNSIAAVMSTYHGWHYSPEWWKEQLRGRVPSRRPRGHSFVRAADRVAS